MRKLKLVIIGVFTGSALLFTGTKYTASSVAGQGGLNAPTGVTASDGDYYNKVGITWNAVRGAITYRILRNTVNDPVTATSVGTTPRAFFFDHTAAVGQQYFFWVVAENGTSSSSVSQSDLGVKAKGTPQGNGPLEPPPPAPPENPLTAAKFTLGKILFWDEQLSSTQTVACGTCHRPNNGGSDPRTSTTDPLSRNPGADGIPNTADDIAGSPGVPLNFESGLYGWSSSFGTNVQVTNRKSPSYINAVYAPILFWDGRANQVFRDPISNEIILNGGGALESQSVGPPMSSVEMAHSGRNWTQAAVQIEGSRPLALSANVPESLANWIDGRSYPELFAEAFGTPEVSPAKIAMAIGSFERGLFSDRTPFDRENAGIEPLTPAEQRGQAIFIGSDCTFCHGGNLLTDNNFHNIGVRPQIEDPGRFAVTGQPEHRGAFRTPSLRNVELRAPYMRTGRFATLEEVVEFYNRGGDFPNDPNVPTVIRPLNLTPLEKADLVAFMKRPLTDPRVANESGPFERPGLYTESDRVPVILGTGTTGTGGRLPKAIAIEPPILGNPSFTVAVSNSMPNAGAVLVIDDSDPGNTSNIPSSGSFALRTVQLASGGSEGYGSVSLAIPNSAAYSGRTFYGRWYVNDPGASGGVAVSQAFRFTVFGTASVSSRANFDYDGDGKSDPSVFRASNGTWYVSRSGLGDMYVMPWGLAGDNIVPADYDGDGKTDLAVRRPADNNFYIFNSSNSTMEVRNFGISGDIALPSDYNGDGKADVAVWRPSNGTWYLSLSGSGIFYVMPWGLAADKPVPGDYDGDGKTDLAVFRPTEGRWYMFNTVTGAFSTNDFGMNGDTPVQADYSGDGKTDFAVYRASNNTWYRQHTNDGTFNVSQWGLAGDFPTPGDFDGDGRTDVAVWRPSDGTWYVLKSTSGVFTQSFGTSGDTPTPNAFVY